MQEASKLEVKAQQRSSVKAKKTPEESSLIVSRRRENLMHHMGEWLESQALLANIGEAERSIAPPMEKDFAVLIHMSKGYLSLIKSGAKQINDKLARQIEVHLGLKPGALDSEAQQQSARQAKAEDRFMSLAKKAWQGLEPVHRSSLEGLMSDSDLPALLTFLSNRKKS